MVNVMSYAAAVYYLAEKAEKEGLSFSNLKIQKLIYYAQGFHLGVYDCPLFEQKIEAWPHGPVIRPLYHSLKQFGMRNIALASLVACLGVQSAEGLSHEQKSVLDMVYDEHGHKKALVLREQTHQESPWLLHSSNGAADGSADQMEITIDELKGYFTPKLVETYISKVDNALDALLEGGYVDIPKTLNSEEDFIAWMTA
jgi:uncharacterized phage-associated protein